MRVNGKIDSNEERAVMRESDDRA